MHLHRLPINLSTYLPTDHPRLSYFVPLSILHPVVSLSPMPAAQFALTGLMLPGIMLIPSIGGSPRIFAQLKTAAREDALVTAFLRLLRRLSLAPLIALV